MSNTDTQRINELEDKVKFLDDMEAAQAARNKLVLDAFTEVHKRLVGLEALKTKGEE